MSFGGFSALLLVLAVCATFDHFTSAAGAKRRPPMRFGKRLGNPLLLYRQPKDEADRMRPPVRFGKRLGKGDLNEGQPEVMENVVPLRNWRPVKFPIEGKGKRSGLRHFDSDEFGYGGIEGDYEEKRSRPFRLNRIRLLNRP